MKRFTHLFLPSQYDNERRLKLNDLNDNSPVFTTEAYSAEVSEVTDCMVHELRNWITSMLVTSLQP